MGWCVWEEVMGAGKVTAGDLNIQQNIVGPLHVALSGPHLAIHMYICMYRRCSNFSRLHISELKE